MVPDPFHRETKLVLITTLWNCVQDPVRRHEQIETATERRVGMKHPASRILIENTKPRRFRARMISDSVIIIYLPALNLLLRERHLKSRVEITPIGRHPIEVPAHSLLECLPLNERRP